jgi:hypothetical protein
MKGVIFAAFLVACASSLESQTVASLSQSPAGPPELRIRNNAAIGLTAFAITMNPVASETGNRGPCLVFLDAVVDEAPPLRPGQERTFPVLFRVRPGKKN